MASNYDITMRQFNGVDYDTLYPKTIATQIDGKISENQLDTEFVDKVDDAVSTANQALAVAQGAGLIEDVLWENSETSYVSSTVLNLAKPITDYKIIIITVKSAPETSQTGTTPIYSTAIAPPPVGKGARDLDLYTFVSFVESSSIGGRVFYTPTATTCYFAGAQGWTFSSTPTSWLSDTRLVPLKILGIK